jgi:hypothetical protein
MDGESEAIEGLAERIGANEGWSDDDTVGTRETDGTSEGEMPLGSCVTLGRLEGKRVGRFDGEGVGLLVGFVLGLCVGVSVG